MKVIALARTQVTTMELLVVSFQLKKIHFNKNYVTLKWQRKDTYLHAV